MKPRTKDKLTRAEKNELTKKNLFDAAVKVVGEMGYRQASVADITARAEIAQGTFYNYFESKQHILDELLPELGKKLLEYLGEQVGDATHLEREERSIRAYFQFIRNNPEFYRILTEAQVYAPRSFKTHVDNLLRNYVHSLNRTKANGFLSEYSPEEFEALAAILLGARVYLTNQFRTGKSRTAPEHVIQTFMKFVSMGLGGSDVTSKRRRPTKQPVTSSSEVPSGEVFKVSDGELRVTYLVPTEFVGINSAQSGAFVHRLATDLLVRAGDLLTGMHLRTVQIGLTTEELPSTVVARCRIEHHSVDEDIASLTLRAEDEHTLTMLAYGQAVFARG